MADGSDGEEEAPAEAKPKTSFLSVGDAESVQLVFTQADADEGHGEEGHSSDDDYSSAATEYSRRGGRRGRGRKKNHRRIVISLVSCKYDVVAQAARGLGWRCTVDDSEEYNLLWNDSYVPFDTIANLNKYQKANHFPGMSELAKKNLLAKNMNRISKALPGEFGFVPSTFILPGESEGLKSWFQSQKRRPTLILKPDAGCQGKGIFLTKSLDECLSVEGMIAQQYLPAPLLVDGYKFDMRLYVLVVSCSPLRVLLFKEGLARFCTERYRAPNESNMDDTFMHLTNFAINKHSEEFTIDESGEGGSKRSISSLFAWLRENGYPTEKIWSQIKILITKTLLAVQPHLQHVYHSLLGEDNVGFSCFEILGFDVMLDRKAKPWLLEVNHAPSFSCGSSLDLKIKLELLRNTMRLIHLQGDAAAHAHAHARARRPPRPLAPPPLASPLPPALSSPWLDRMVWLTS